MKVSVIVPIYKAEKYIERCARSLFEQTLDDIEYIFVNDCTPDRSMWVLQQVAKEYPHRLANIRILNHEKNTGQSGARRDGMAVASGEYVIHCDADDWVELDMYESMYSKAIETGSDAVTCDLIQEFNGHTQVLHYNNTYEDHRLMYDCFVPISVEYCSMCNRLISRKVFQEHAVLPFERVNMWDDVGLAIRLRYYISHTEVINKAYYHYNRQNEASTTKRPILSRSMEQIECVRQLETFFVQEGSAHLYRCFIAFLKFEAKKDLFEGGRQSVGCHLSGS